MDGGSNGLGKLLPKSITAKRRRRKQKLARDSEAAGLGDAASRRPSKSDDTNSTNMADDEDADGSFASYGSSADPDQSDSLPSRRPASASASPPAPPATVSAHPSLIGCPTPSSPVVQPTLVDSQAHFQPLPPRRPSPAASASNQDAAAGPPIAPIPEPPAAAKIAPPTAHPRAPPLLDTRPPQTPPTGHGPAPVIVNTPPTPIDRVEQAAGRWLETRKTPRSGGGPRASTDGNPPSQSMITAHRRSKSGASAIGPSKLSNITPSPLTPTAETGEPAPNAPGFFSSVISAAQNAATTFSNNIPGAGISIGGNRSRSSLPKSQGSSAPSPAEAEPEPAPEAQLGESMDQKDSAVRTLGSGDLSLSQLGIAEPASSVASPASTKFSMDAMADARARSDSAPADSQVRTAEIVPEETSSRPRSLVEATSGDQTPPQFDVDHRTTGPQRSASIRSAIKPHRKRGSSVNTGSTRTTVGAAIAAANSSVMQPTGGGLGAPKLTGFAIASKKRNRDFHNLFKSVPDDDYLIEDYSCALQREILAHGRLYVSEGHLCFSSNILGWTTTLVMSFDEIVSVEKRSTALVFKNGLMISTLHAKHIFASFTSRDATYDLIVNIWKLGHPTLKSTLNGVRLEGTGGDKTEKVDAEPSGLDNEAQAASESENESDDDDDAAGCDDDEGDDDDFYDEEENEHDAETQATDLNGVDAEAERPVSRKVSAVTVANGVQADVAKETPATSGSVDFPGPATHAPTDCGDSASHYEKVVGDDVIPAPLGKVYNLIFGPPSVTWMARWLTGDQKCTELQVDDKKGLGPDNKLRSYSYIKPLNASLGPKQTKCIVSETLDSLDYEKAISLSVSTQTPDVPSGNVFSVKTKYCLSWAENNATRIQVNCTIEWTGKSWIKGPIEKGANDGQTQYCKDLFAALKASVSSRPRAGTGPGGQAKMRKKLKRSKALQSVDGSAERNSRAEHVAKRNWGPLEPVRGLVEPCIDVIRPVLTGNVMYGLLVGLLVAMWFGFGLTPSKSPGSYGPDIGFYSPSRLVAYEEMWRREDSELWEWLEERVGLDRLGSTRSNARQRTPELRDMEERLREERMDEREVQEAIRVTEEKLKVLRQVLGKGSRDRTGARRDGR